MSRVDNYHSESKLYCPDEIENFVDLNFESNVGNAKFVKLKFVSFRG